MKIKVENGEKRTAQNMTKTNCPNYGEGGQQLVVLADVVKGVCLFLFVNRGDFKFYRLIAWISVALNSRSLASLCWFVAL